MKALVDGIALCAGDVDLPAIVADQSLLASELDLGRELGENFKNALEPMAANGSMRRQPDTA